MLMRDSSRITSCPLSASPFCVSCLHLAAFTLSWSSQNTLPAATAADVERASGSADGSLLEHGRGANRVAGAFEGRAVALSGAGAPPTLDPPRQGAGSSTDVGAQCGPIPQDGARSVAERVVHDRPVCVDEGAPAAKRRRLVGKQRPTC